MAADLYLPRDVVVESVEDLTPYLRRVVLTGPDLDRVHPTTLDRRIKLVLPRAEGDTLPDLPRDARWYDAWRALPDDARPAVRTYTARAVRPRDRALVVDLVLHDHPGPAGRWATTARPGDPLVAVCPVAGAPGADRCGIAWHPGRATQVLLAGDETALPAIASILESLGDHVTGEVLLEVPSSDSDISTSDSTASSDGDLALDAPPGVTVSVLPRGARPHGEVLEEAVRHTAWSPLEESEVARREALSTGPEEILWDEPQHVSADHYAWLAGESGLIRRLRRHLVGERGWPRDRVAFMGYWSLGRPES